MPDIVTDISINQNWNARKGANNPVTFTFIQSAAAFNISTYTFSVQLRKFGSDTNLLNLTQGSGITNNGAAGTLNVVFTSANLTNLVANDYYWQMTVVNPDTFSYLWYQGTFNLYAETYTGDLTSAVTGTIDLNGTTINTSVTLGVSGVVSVVAGSNITVDNTDPLNPVISSSQTTSIQTVTSAATVTALSTNDYVEITAQAEALTIANPSGTPTNFAMIVYRIKDNGTARAITFGDQFRAIGTALPTTTTAGKVLYICSLWNAADSKWDTVNHLEV